MDKSLNCNAFCAGFLRILPVPPRIRGKLVLSSLINRLVAVFSPSLMSSGLSDENIVELLDRFPHCFSVRNLERENQTSEEKRKKNLQGIRT